MLRGRLSSAWASSSLSYSSTYLAVHRRRFFGQPELPLQYRSPHGLEDHSNWVGCSLSLDRRDIDRAVLRWTTAWRGVLALHRSLEVRTSVLDCRRRRG